MSGKIRLDLLVQQLHPQYSRGQIQSWIMQGKILVDDKIVTKSGTQVKPDVKILITASDPKYVGRAGLKLEGALTNFAIDVKELVVLDAGLSTGGFTDCLLQAGAKKVYGIDVGYGQVHEKIRQDKRVVVVEHLNLRHVQKVLDLLEIPVIVEGQKDKSKKGANIRVSDSLEAQCQLQLSPVDLRRLKKFEDKQVDMVTLDLSFISALKVMETVRAVLKQGGKLVVLIKPQFEAEHHEICRGGIVKDEKIRKRIIEKIVSGIIDFGFDFIGVIDSPIEGATGNKEFLAYFIKK